MLHDIAGMRNYTRNQHCSLGQPDSLPNVIFMLVPGVCRFEAQCARVHFQHIWHDFFHRGIMHARPLVDSVTGMEAHSFGRKTAETFIYCFDEHSSAALALRRTERRISKNVSEERIVDLQDQSRIDNGFIFNVKRSTGSVK